MKNVVKKLNEDDILEILIEHFQCKKNSQFCGYAKFYGMPGQDLRAVIVVTRDPCSDINLDDIEKNIEYNGDHQFLSEHSEFDLSKRFESVKVEDD